MDPTIDLQIDRAQTQMLRQPDLTGAKSNDEAAREKARKAAKDFEAVFISQMLEQMDKGIKSDGMFGGGHAEDVNRSMLNQEYGKIIAQRGGIGISDAVFNEMLKLQAPQKGAGS